MRLQVITPDGGHEIDREVSVVSADSTLGAFDILEGHMPMVVALKDQSCLSFRGSQDSESPSPDKFCVQSAILEVVSGQSETHVKVITSELIEQR
jgi:F0F1-type ATP synthase epsilon subunit